MKLGEAAEACIVTLRIQDYVLFGNGGEVVADEVDRGSVG